MAWDSENRLSYTSKEYEQLKADKKRQAENLENEIERIAEEMNDLIEKNVHLLAENKRLKKWLKNIITTKDFIIKRLNRRLTDIGGQC